MELYIQHHGIQGQKWGVRRFQEEDGTLTEAGKRRYGRGSSAGMPSDVPKSGYKVTNRSSSAGMPSNVPKSGYKVTNRSSSAGMPSNVPKSVYKVTNRSSSAGMPSNIPASIYGYGTTVDRTNDGTYVVQTPLFNDPIYKDPIFSDWDPKKLYMTPIEELYAYKKLANATKADKVTVQRNDDKTRPNASESSREVTNRPYGDDPVYNDPRLKNVPDEFLYGTSPETLRRYLENKEKKIENTLHDSYSTLNELSRLSKSTDNHDRATLHANRYETITNATKAASLIISISAAQAKSAYEYENYQRKTTVSALKKLSNSLGKIVKSVSGIFK